MVGRRDFLRNSFMAVAITLLPKSLLPCDPIKFTKPERYVVQYFKIYDTMINDRRWIELMMTSKINELKHIRNLEPPIVQFGYDNEDFVNARLTCLMKFKIKDDE